MKKNHHTQARSETPSSLASKPRMACFGLLGMDVQARQERVGRTYEIARRPSKPEAHTVYIRGIKDDLLAQITREDSSLLISDKSESLNADRLALSSGILKSISICKDKSVDCGQYLKNASKFYLNKYVVDGLYHSKYKNLRMIVGWGIVLGLLYWLVYSQLSNGSISFGNIYRFVSPLLLTSILFTFTSGCGIFTTGGGQGDAPWLLLGSGINNDTPSVRDDGMVVSGGGGGIPFTVPVTGMYFVHSDHLGSVSFLTNGRGAIVAGGEFGGKSDIQYKPYGEIDRPHSSGPDITKYKYTGQEEDKESGLLYYKARYYDPGLGRFLQADEEVHPESVQGMNRCMYAEGNPVKNSDDSGYRLSTPLAWAWLEVLTMNKDSSHEERVAAFARGYVKGNDARKEERKEKEQQRVLGVIKGISNIAFALSAFFFTAAALAGITGIGSIFGVGFLVLGVIFGFVGVFMACFYNLMSDYYYPENKNNYTEVYSKYKTNEFQQLGNDQGNNGKTQFSEIKCSRKRERS